MGILLVRLPVFLMMNMEPVLRATLNAPLVACQNRKSVPLPLTRTSMIRGRTEVRILGPHSVHLLPGPIAVEPAKWAALP